MSKHGKVLVAMSGGIDSTLAAVMLHEQGYEVIGMTMKTWDYASSGGSKKETGCCSLDSINDARAVAVKVGFPHYILDIRSEFGDQIIDDFVSEYIAGRTPNPCVLCNTFIKWEALLKRADSLDCEHIATGHYAQVRYEKGFLKARSRDLAFKNGRYIVSKGLDDRKDQSYVLWGLSQKNLGRTIYPLGQFKKSEIRAMAEERGYHELVNKSESYEICFIPDNDYRGFLSRKVNGLAEKVADGNFVNASGEVLGKHRGYPFYTIGQRKGLKIALGEPMYVTEIIPKTNVVVLGKQKELERKDMWVGKINLVKYPEIKEGMKSVTKIRYHDKGASSELYPKGKRIKVVFDDTVSAIAPGQSAVFYEGDDVIGGGIIN